jgi:ribonuclease-3
MPLVSKPGETPDSGAVEAARRRLGVRLDDPEALVRALTHSSFANENPIRIDGKPTANNERDEFLGDAVLDLAASHLIMERFPSAAEGELSRLRASLVNERRLADVSRRLGIGDLLLLGKGEEMSGGREKESLLADGFEAVVGAIYQAGGYLDALEFLRAQFAPYLEELGAPGFDRDFKTRLQELAQSRLKTTPRYQLVREDGPDHDKTFQVNLVIGGAVRGVGTGKSKKDAEQEAARRALESLEAEPEEAH